MLYAIHIKHSLAEIPDALEYSGIVIIKRAADTPTTSEPVVFGYAKLQHQRRPLLPSATALGLDEDKVTVSFVTSIIITACRIFWLVDQIYIYEHYVQLLCTVMLH
jgi:hypothetical protein